MAQRPRKNCRWPFALAEVLLLGMFASTAFAVNAVPSPDSAVSGTPALEADQVESMSAIGGSDLYLDVTLNGSSSGLAHFGLRDGALWATSATLRQLGFALPDGTSDPVRLTALQGMQVHYDQEHQSVDITAPLALLKLSTHVLNTQQVAAAKASASPGLLLNYSLYGSHEENGSSSLNAFTELRAFNGNSVFSTTSLAQTTRAGGAWSNHNVRMDTSWSMSFPDSMVTLRAGDALTGATTWSRSTRIGGVQIGTNFALQPYRVTTPLPAFTGAAVLPSEVELYINGMRQYATKVPAGPFELNAVPGINGAGNAQIVLTDSLGRVTSMDFSLYNSQQLLQKGLADWSAELGAVRENYGLSSFSYGHDAIASGTWRYGVSDTFTAETHGEATRGLSSGGAGGDWLLGATGGVLAASAATSIDHGSGGSQFSVGYHWNDNFFNFGLNALKASSGYRDVASLYGSPPPRLTASAQAGINTIRFGGLGLSYVHLRYEAQTNRYASAYWYKSIGRAVSLNFNVNQNLDQRRDRSFFLTVGFTLDNNTYLSGGMQRNGDQDGFTVNASHSVPSAGGFGWRTQLQHSDGGVDGQGELDYLGRYGEVQAGVGRYGNSDSAYAGANGSLVLMGGQMFASRTIYDGFAVVSTDGVAGIPVRLENNPVGTTDKRGMLLVTPLSAYQNNQLSIDPMELPANMRIGRINLLATPTDRAGTLVRFDIAPIRAASITLVDTTGKPLPLGSRVRLRGQQIEPALVGFDGAAYLDTLDKHNILDVDTPGGACQVAFDYHRQGDSIPQIGPLICAPGKTL